MIAITQLPLGVGCDEVTQALAARVDSGRRRLGRDREPDFAELGLPLRDVRDESYGTTTKIVCELRAGADVERAAQQIASTWGVTIREAVQLSAPLAELLRDLVDDNADAQRTALAALAARPGS